MIWRIVIFVSLVCPAIANAQEVRVRSGEHDGFTRLVFDLPVSVSWRIEEPANDNLIALQLDQPELTFDFSQVYQRIDRRRIASVQQSDVGGRAEIALGCACRAEAFVVRDRMLVVDISPKEPVLAETMPDGALAAPGDLSAVRLTGLPGIGPAPADNALLPRVGRVISDDTMTVQNDALSDVGRTIAEDLAKAATRGLLSPNVNARPVAKPVQQAPLSQGSDDASAAAVMALEAQLRNLGSLVGQDGALSIGGTACTPANELALPDWVGDEPMHTAISNARSTIYGEFDRLRSEDVLDYARSLLHFGLGAEARDALSLLETSDPMLTALSYAVDGESDPTRFFAFQNTCKGPAAMWSVLTAPPETQFTGIDNNSILQALESLPRDLRIHLGPKLADRLTLAGQQQTAREVLSRLERANGDTTTDIEMGHARLAEKDGDLETARAAFAKLAGENSPAAPEALISAIELAHETNAPVTESLVALTEAYATERRNTPEGPQFRAAEIKAHLSNGALHDAKTLLKSSKDLPDDMLQTLGQDVFSALSAISDPVEFLKNALDPDILELATGRDADAIRTAKRLVEMGLYREALDYLNAVRTSPAPTDAKLVQAQALIGLSRPEEAEIALIGTRDQDAVRLRAEARSMMGDHAYARGVFDDLGEEDAALNAAWLSGDLEGVAARQDSALGQIAAQLTPNPDIDGATDAGLANAANLTKASADARAAVQDLLDATQVLSDN